MWWQLISGFQCSVTTAHLISVWCSCRRMSASSVSRIVWYGCAMAHVGRMPRATAHTICSVPLYTNRSSTSSCDTQHTPSAGCCCTPTGHPPAAATHNTHLCRMLLYTNRSSTSSCDTQHTPSAACRCTPTGHPPAAVTHNTHHLQDVVVHQQVIHQQLRHTTHTICRMLYTNRSSTSSCDTQHTPLQDVVVHQHVIHQQLRHTTHTICRMLLCTNRSSTSSCDRQHTPLQDVVVHQQVIHQQL